MDWETKTSLGRTGLQVGRLGVAAGYGAEAGAFEAAFERGCNYFYWASRKDGMRQAIRNLVGQGKRDQLVVAVQSYTRWAWYQERSFRKALAQLGIEQADVFLLGWFNSPPSAAIVDRALALKEKGLFRHLGMSGHSRKLFPVMAKTGHFDLFHVRYNAAHRGAETETFDKLGEGDQRHGVVTYTATRWGKLLKASKMPPGENPLSASDCYRFVMSNSKVDVCLTGPRDMDQMKQALQSLDEGPMSEEEITRARRIGDFVHNKP
jgi:aryl-alcohol dehydrogenase-like predicted oxidoreductase